MPDIKRRSGALTPRTRPATACRRIGYALVILLLAGCKGVLTLPEDAHVFGQYEACVQRISDTCVDADGSCRSKAANMHLYLVGVRRGTSEFLIAREGLDPIAGVLEGTRFRAETTVELPDICGCPAQVTEIIEGELLPAPIGAIACEPNDVDGGTCSAQPPDVDGGDGDGGGAVDAGEVDFERRYAAIRGTVTNEVRAIGGQACACLPCRAEFEFLGRP